MSNLDAALSMAAKGFRVFPAHDKRPLVNWSTEASAVPDVVAGWWKRWPDAQIGLPMPPRTVAVDIDDVDAAREANASGLIEFVMTPGQATPRGFHYFYRTDGRDVPQFTKAYGVDTRVGGRGYVIVYEPDNVPPVDEWAPAPEWLYAFRPPAGPEAPRDTSTMGTRGDILSWLGSFPARGLALSAAEYLSLLRTALSEGRIVSLDPRRPWADEDLATLASEAAKWEVNIPLPSPAMGLPPGPSGAMDALDLLRLDLPPLRWAVDSLVPEGMGLLAAPPKTGKSLFAYQLAVHLNLGIPLLGYEAERRPVRYYALEDGERRSQDRIKNVLKGMPLHPGLELKWDAPRLGGPLETEVSEYLSEHPNGVVIIDVLAKVRGAHSVKGKNAYDEDYDALSGLHGVAKLHPGSTVLIVTHDRKAGSDDWMTRVTGTRGVTGAADFTIFINRKRGENDGTIVSTGRDSADIAIPVQFTGEGWRSADPTTLIGAKSAIRVAIHQWLLANGPAHKAQIARGLGEKFDTVVHRVDDMEKDGQLVAGKDGYYVPGADDDE